MRSVTLCLALLYLATPKVTATYDSGSTGCGTTTLIAYGFTKTFTKSSLTVSHCQWIIKEHGFVTPSSNYLWILVKLGSRSLCGSNSSISITDLDRYGDGEMYSVDLCRDVEFSRYFYSSVKIAYWTNDDLLLPSISIRYKSSDLGYLGKCNQTKLALPKYSYIINLEVLPKQPYTVCYLRFKGLSALSHTKITFSILTSTFCTHSSAIVYDGYTPTESMKTYNMCSSHASFKETIISSGRYLYFEMVLIPSDKMEQFTTRITPTSITDPPVDMCKGGNVMNLTATLSYKYINANAMLSHSAGDLMTCKWVITAEDNYHVLVNIRDMGAPAYSNCSSYSLTIYEGSHFEHALSMEMCTDRYVGKMFESRSSSVGIEFTYNQRLYPKGVNIRYTASRTEPDGDTINYTTTRTATNFKPLSIHHSNGLSSTIVWLIISISLVTIFTFAALGGYRYQRMVRGNAAARRRPGCFVTTNSSSIGMSPHTMGSPPATGAPVAGLAPPPYSAVVNSPQTYVASLNSQNQRVGLDNPTYNGILDTDNTNPSRLNDQQDGHGSHGNDSGTADAVYDNPGNVSTYDTIGALAGHGDDKPPEYAQLFQK